MQPRERESGKLRQKEILKGLGFEEEDAPPEPMLPRGEEQK